MFNLFAFQGHCNGKPNLDCLLITTLSKQKMDWFEKENGSMNSVLKQTTEVVLRARPHSLCSTGCILLYFITD